MVYYYCYKGVTISIISIHVLVSRVGYQAQQSSSVLPPSSHLSQPSACIFQMWNYEASQEETKDESRRTVAPNPPPFLAYFICTLFTTNFSYPPTVIVL